MSGLEEAGVEDLDLNAHHGDFIEFNFVLEQRYFGGFDLLVSADGGDFDVKIFEQLNFERIADISFEQEESAVVFVVSLTQQSIGLEPCPDGDSLTKNPLGVVIKHFYRVDG